TRGANDNSPSTSGAVTNSANPASSATTTPPAPPSTSASVEPPGSTAGIPPLRRSGRITLNTQDLSGVDLDSQAPDWSVGDISRRRADLYLGYRDSHRVPTASRGLLSATIIGPDSFRECQASTQTNVDIEERTIKKLPLICLTTDEDRIAVIKIVSYDE